MWHDEKPSAPSSQTSLPFNPTLTYYIKPHCSWTKTIEILDLTPHLTIPYGSSDFPAHTKSIAKTPSLAPSLTVQKQNVWGTKYGIFENSENGEREIAKWTASCFSTGRSHIKFLEEGGKSRHDITLQKPAGISMLSRDESFVFNSVEYLWSYESWYCAHRIQLFRMLPGGEKQLVARFWQGWDWKTGGTFVVDARELDEVVGVITCVVELKKRRQRQHENQGG
ncbi:MAG: hypothetical protein M1839_008565 [Geoglossum umbratile]|nr:MAG: hypothetical protein M1839_008565 [Geoglossum umbratile]